MSDYLAPLADMRFTLREIAGLANVATLPGCDTAPIRIDSYRP